MVEQRPIKVAAADRHAIVRAGIRAVLEKEGGFEFLWETSDSREVVAMAKQYPPDVLTTALLFPWLSGVDVARQLKTHAPNTGVVIYSEYANESYVIDALKLMLSRNRHAMN